MTTLALALLLGATDGGVAADFKAPIYGSCVEAPPAVRVDGGYWVMPDAREQRIACLMTTCDVDRQTKTRLLGEQPPPPSFLLVGFIATAALALGAVLGKYLPF